MKGGYERGDNGVPGFGCVAEDGSVENRPLAVFCSGLLGPKTGGRPAYGFVVASCIGPPKRSSKTLGVGPFARSGGNPYDGPTGGFEGGIVHSHAALLVEGPGGGLLRGLGEEALLAVSEYQAALAALAWLEAQGRSGERILLFTGSRPLAKRYEEPFGLWRATRRRTGEGAALSEVLATLSRFGDLRVDWWRPGCPGRPEELVALAGEAAQEISAKTRAAVLEEVRRVRAKDVELERVGRGLYRANDRYLVDAIFGLCGCRDFERHNGGKKRQKKAGVPLVVVRCKHLIAAEEAEREAYRRYHHPAPSRNASTPSPVPGAKSKARGGKARAGQNP